MRLLKLLEIFIRYTDENHPLSLQEIMTLLQIDVNRKTLYKDIQLLNTLGFEIIIIKGSVMKYYLLNHPLETIDVKIIGDALRTIHYLPSHKINTIMDKLYQLISVYNAKSIQMTQYSPNDTYQNTQLIYHLDTLQHAIAKNQAVSFKYFDRDLSNNIQYRRQNQFYELIPYHLILKQGYYYCVFYSNHYENYSNYRIDRMAQLSILPGTVIKKPFDINRYINTSFNMFVGKQEHVIIRFDNSVYPIVVDRFNDDFIISEKKEAYFIAHFNITLSDSFFSWVTQFSNKATLIGPHHVQEKFKIFLQTILNAYHD